MEKKEGKQVFSLIGISQGHRSETSAGIYMLGGGERRKEERNTFGLIITSEDLSLERGGDVKRQRQPDITIVLNI